MIDTQKEVFCIIDALDECNDDLRWALIEKLETLGPKLRVLITSRYLDSIAEELEGYQRFEIRANKADIELFIDYQVRRNRNLRKIVEKSPSLRDDIKQGVFKTAEKMQAATNPYDSCLVDWIIGSYWLACMSSHWPARLVFPLSMSGTNSGPSRPPLRVPMIMLWRGSRIRSQITNVLHSRQWHGCVMHSAPCH